MFPDKYSKSGVFLTGQIRYRKGAANDDDKHNDCLRFSVFEVLDNDTIIDLTREIQNGKVILCDDIDEMENTEPTSKLCECYRHNDGFRAYTAIPS